MLNWHLPPGSSEYFQERATEAHQQGKSKKVNKQNHPQTRTGKNLLKSHSDHISKDCQVIPLNSHKYNTVAFHIAKTRYLDLQIKLS